MDHRRLAMRGRRNAVMSAPLRVGTARPVARKLSDSDSIIVPPAVALRSRTGTLTICAGQFASGFAVARSIWDNGLVVTNLAQNVPLSLARMAAALTYLDALDQIEGWLLPTTALAMIEALWAQERRGYAGDIAEIGVWQGKSFLALAAGARPGERLVAIDPFDAGDPTAQRPDLDVTPYGAGYKGAFLANLSRFFPAVQPEIIEASSGALANDRSPLGKLRFLSIDGGHSRAQTLIDLRIADACLTEQGLCWLDDVFNPAWPGVVSGLFAYLDSGPGLQPLVLFPNKLGTSSASHGRNLAYGVSSTICWRDLSGGSRTASVCHRRLRRSLVQILFSPARLSPLRQEPPSNARQRSQPARRARPMPSIGRRQRKRRFWRVRRARPGESLRPLGYWDTSCAIRRNPGTNWIDWH